ncbi:hypothetical protein SU69_07310 [Thermosipho melanesiensis]|uniref:Uncharacterized protein n=3 Tax=Thermosipho melanesiensis TaxID=46541 RepID=A6LMY6_THEM4|nr:hypothetical protein [Thermosipho melanesiensis]ABR31287.1 hypothetical protein Tmel_1440 [Thermosipho melanesiensis BI429]APT74366.1 hypothetical protein BW47_07635 [Thermosipho melanesiensis]OOC36310.1 hypothetical protein SU68_07380 [Thermosipho melanesiensis]OOC37128.1 hypothetical protein SU69_07310 [Thermosipho melanesiensis]OOC37880.1 hypothetical protein SU70_07320 [Thermosipho melanesiensis]
MGIEDKVIEHDVEIKGIKEDIQEMKSDIKDIKKMLNGYLDKRIENKVKTMSGYIEEIAINAYAKLAGKRALAFAVSIVLSLITGALAGRFFWR